MEKKSKEKTCFVISPIGKEDSETRKRADQILKHIITPAVSKFGYKPIRADEIDEPGIITSQVIQKIVDSDLVIADLSEKNPNVFYELAIRHAIKKPLIQIIRKDEVIPFDVAATRIIHFDIKDLDSVDNAKKEILKQIESIEKGNMDFENPISISLDLKLLKESGNPEERSFADIIEAITDLRSGLVNLERNISNPERILPPNYLENIFRRIYRANINKISSSRLDEIGFLLKDTINMFRVLKKKIVLKSSNKTFIEDLSEFENRLDHLYMLIRGSLLEDF